MRLFNLIVYALKEVFHASPLAPALAPDAPHIDAKGFAEQFSLSEELDRLAAKENEPLNWRKSIVDLLKVIGVDSRGQARRTLARELGYPGPTEHIADGYFAMNEWLHAEVIRLARERGIPLPIVS